MGQGWTDAKYTDAISTCYTGYFKAVRESSVARFTNKKLQFVV